MKTPKAPANAADNKISRAIAVTTSSKQGTASFAAPSANPIVAPPPAQLKKIELGKNDDKTTVEWLEGNLAGSKDVVGTGMQALNLHKGNVDQGELVGTPPKASAQKDLMAQLPTRPSLKTTNKYVKGHLLNHNIGGPGEAFNLFPITASANSAHHSFVEKAVKESVRKGNYVNYKVEVKNITDNTKDGNKAGTVNATFNCQAKDLNSKSAFTRDIVSEFDTKAVVKDLAFKNDFAFSANDKNNFPSDSWLGGIYNTVKDEDDAKKVDDRIEHFAKTTTEAFVEEHALRKDDQNSSIVKLLKEMFSSKGKRFTEKQQGEIHNMIVDVTFAYLVSKDASTQAEYESECPLLVNILKSKPF